MIVLTTNCFKVKNDLKKIGGENSSNKRNGEEPYKMEFIFRLT